jgi:hypothetical protein
MLIEAYDTSYKDPDVQKFYRTFNRFFLDREGKCALTRFVRCLALRYIDALKTVGKLGAPYQGDELARTAAEMESSDSEDDVPLAQLKKPRHR